MSQTELLDQFILEARECLELISQRLLDVERDPNNRELLNDLFRSVHTLKGNCGLFDFKALERVVHAGEDLLDRVRNGELEYHGGIADALLAAMDYTAELVDVIATEGQLPAQANGRATELAEGLRRHLNGPAPAATSSAAPAAPASASAPVAAAAAAASGTGTGSALLTTDGSAAPAWVARIPVSVRRHEGTAVRYVPERQCFFKGEDPWHQARGTPGLEWIDASPVTPWPAAEAFDCYDCNLEMVLFSGAPSAYVQEHFRYVPEQVEVVALPAVTAYEPTSSMESAAAAALAHPAAAEVDAEVVAAHAKTELRRLTARTLQLWQEQQALLARPAISAGTVVAVRRVFEHLIACGVWGERSASVLHSLSVLSDGATPLAQWAAENAPDGVSFDRTASADAGLVAPPAPRHGAATIEVISPAAAEAPLETAAGAGSGGGAVAASAGGGSGAGPAGGGDAGHRVLKVSQDKIDRLMDLIGGMVVAKNALPYLAVRAEETFGQRELAREIKAQYSVINRIAEDMQHAIMQVRMLPVGTVFQRFGRLVRDISKKLGKDVQLVVEGEDTEADKNVIESLADPLIHILRNSLDHGLELPEVRRKAGKLPQGTLKVSARQEGDRVILDISDDGAGIDTARVRAKAIERGLIPADRAELLTEDEAVQLVFLPGFSTAETISDLSGRGVGMDVVRSAVERINGTVSLSSQRGKGTLISLALPLSMAVTNVMMIEAGNRRFGVPMDLIVETVRVHAEDIHHFKQSQTTVLRGRIVPLRSLHELLALDAAPRVNAANEHAVLVVRLGSENVGLLVDDFHGTSDIILKPLEGVLSGITGFAGTALMGDGSVLMILNPKELV